jgi:L-lysine 6-oxidase
LNSGTNSVSNVQIDKFLTLTPTQYFLLGQWAAGKFNAQKEEIPLSSLDRGSVGNAVGSPMCPGIEVTWSVRNPAIYAAPYRIKQAHAEDYYAENGLSPAVDECELQGGKAPGCEPGDLTKRMAIPWQADFFQCTVQFINFTDPNKNKDNGIPKPPTYFGYWWPPQSPMFVMSPIMNVAEQAISGVPSGFQVYYARGINTFTEMITAWAYLGFIVNRNTSPSGSDYPSFEEAERNHNKFGVSSVAVGPADLVYTGPDVQSMTDPSLKLSVAVGKVDNVVTNSEAYFVPMWFLLEGSAPTAMSDAAKVRQAALQPGAQLEREALPKPVTSYGIGRLHRSKH